MRPRFVAPELDPELGIAHCLTPEALDRALTETPNAVGATAVSPTYFGAVADVAGLAEVAHAHGVPLVVDEAWGAHLAFHEDLPPHALSLGADLVISSTHKIVGSLTQSAIVHLGHRGAARRGRGGPRGDAGRVHQPQLAAARLAGRRAAAGGRPAATTCSTRPSPRWPPPATRCGRCRGSTCSTSGSPGAPGVRGYDPLRLAIDVRGTGESGYELAAHPARGRRRQPRAGRRERDRRRCSAWASRRGRRASGWWRRCATRSTAWATGRAHSRESFAPPPPWGELVLSPARRVLRPPGGGARGRGRGPGRRRVAGRLPAGRAQRAPRRAADRARRSSTCRRRSTTAAACAAPATAGCARSAWWPVELVRRAAARRPARAAGAVVLGAERAAGGVGAAAALAPDAGLRRARRRGGRGRRAGGALAGGGRRAGGGGGREPPCARRARHGPLALLVLDAHAEADRLAEWLRDDLVDPDRSLVAGVRGPLPEPEELDAVRDRGVELLTGDELRALGPGEYSQRVLARTAGAPCVLCVRPRRVDPAFAPAVRTPEVAGLLPHEAITLLRSLAGTAFAGFELTGLGPVARRPRLRPPPCSPRTSCGRCWRSGYCRPHERREGAPEGGRARPGAGRVLPRHGQQRGRAAAASPAG